MDHEIGHSEYSGQSDRRMPISPSSSGVFFTGADAIAGVVSRVMPRLNPGAEILACFLVYITSCFCF